MDAALPVERARMRFKTTADREVRMNHGKNIIRLIIASALASIGLVALIVYTLPRTTLSVQGLLVQSSVVALGIFLLALVFRYFTVLGAAFHFVTHYSHRSDPDFAPFVSIIVPLYNEEKILQQSVASLLVMDYSNYEIILVNDGSTDRTAELGTALAGYQHGLHGAVRVVFIDKPNGGKSSALNAGIQYSKAEFVLCVDGDSRLTPDTITVSIRHFVDPGVGAVAGNVKVLNRRKLLTKLQALEYVEGLNMLRSAQSSLGLINIVPGPVGLFRKEAVRSAGWYSGDTYAEDADLTLTLRLRGWKIVYEPLAISYTEAPETLFQLLKQRYRWTRGILQSFRKHRRHIHGPLLDFKDNVVLWTLFYEAIIWPTMNIFATLFFISVALVFGLSTTTALWWASIALLDVMTALYCVAVDREQLSLVPYAILYRIVFILVVDVTKFGATIEEVLGLRMTWGKLERIGTSRV
jgi:poly-beta-1,6-N-acetyl-D-glucosamine synthase